MSRAEDTLLQIAEIRRQLWLGHASLMVGSGFSLNAEKASPHISLPPDWAGLARALASRLYPGLPEAEVEQILRNKDALKLAHEFDVTFRRPALNALLYELIQDDNLLPGELHKNMLELPWVDVFTTNYDTLLEKAAKYVIQRKYTTVYSCNDLPYSESPRIIKLHGSFPTEATHLIVTEEDYRTYPDDLSPFVNTVQQSIMESTLCLIGFSGTDPNFLKWIGWVKDNLKKSMPPVYLIGLLDLSMPEMHVLQERNIIPVDLSQLNKETKRDHKKAFESLFKNLNEKPDYINWHPRVSSMMSPTDAASDEKIMAVLNDWKESRKAYPNWIVLPWSTREGLKSLTEFWTSDLEYLKKLENPWDLLGLFEFNWRLEKCLVPIWNHLIPEYEAILQRYNPFELDETTWPVSNLSTAPTSPEVKEAWKALVFAVLRWSREEVDTERWMKYSKIIERIVKDDLVSTNRLYYEKSLYAMAIPDLAQLDTTIAAWGQISRPPEWNVKYASIIAELGKTEEASSLLLATLNEIRPFIPKSRIKNDYYLLSLEGIILVGLCLAESFQNLLTSKKSDVRENYKARLDELKQSDCSPWSNIDRFRLILCRPENAEHTKNFTRNFDNTTVSHTFRSGWPVEPTQAFQFFRFLEETGIPMHIENVNLADKSLAGAIVRTADYSPAWAFSLLNKIGEKNDADCELFYSQKKIHSIDKERVNNLIDIYASQLEYILRNKTVEIGLRDKNFFARLVQNLFEAISRLTVKADHERLQTIFNLGISIYHSDIHDKYILFRNIGTQYFRRLLEVTPPETVYRNLNTLLSVPIQTRSSFWQSPIGEINWRGYKVSPDDASKELTATIDDLIQRLDTPEMPIRSEILLYLNTCWQVNVLRRPQKRRIALNLIKHAQNGELPSDQRFYRFAYLEFLSPIKSRYNAADGLMNYYLNFDFKFFTLSEGKASYVQGESPISFFLRSLIPPCSFLNKKSASGIELSPDNAWTIFSHLNESWESTKEQLTQSIKSKSPFSYAIKDNIQTTLTWCDRALGEVLIPRFTGDASRMDAARALVQGIESINDCPVSRVALAIGRHEYSEDFIYNMVRGISSEQILRCQTYCQATIDAYGFAKKKLLPKPPDRLLHTMLSAIAMKSDRTFRDICYTLGNILDYYTLSEGEEKLLFGTMTSLKDETSFDSSSERFPLADRFDYREAVAYLAVSLYKNFQRRRRADIPPVLQEWYDLCHSDDEFPQLRNIWINKINQQ